MLVVFVSCIIVAAFVVAIYYTYCLARHDSLVKQLRDDDRIAVDEGTRETDRQILIGLEKDGVVRFWTAYGDDSEEGRGRRIGVFLLTEHGRSFLAGELN